MQDEQQLIRYIINTNKSIFTNKKDISIIHNTFSKLSKSDIKQIIENPHSAQCIFQLECNKKGIFKFTRIMEDNLPRLPYMDRRRQVNTLVHNGQIKLLLSEIEFLTNHGHLSNHVLYIASAPGFHIPCLCKMFPDHIFYLYDPAHDKWGTTHLESLQKKGRVFIYSQYFVEATIDEFRHNFPDAKDLLLINDMRGDIGDKSNMALMNKIILSDMELQKKIINIIKPKAAIIKFRLPWDDVNIPYFDGVRYFGAFAPQQSTETRLVVTDINSIKIYNGKKNEEELAFFNTIQRPSLYPHPKIESKLILDHCYDCTAKLSILHHYLKSNYNKDFATLQALHTFVDKEMSSKK